MSDDGDVTWDGLQLVVRSLVGKDVVAKVGDGARQTPTLNAGEMSGESPPLLHPARSKGGDAQAAFDKGLAAFRTDPAAAAELYRKAADLGHAAAARALGTLYQNGTGVAKSDKDAAEWYRKGADRGDRMATTYLGGMYAAGRGVAKDD